MPDNGLREKRAIARDMRLNPTPEEDLLWQHLRRNQVSGQHFRRQHVLAGFIVDFYCRSAGLVIELDGRHHEDQREADAEREAVLRGLGLTVMRFPNRQVREALERVVELIEAKVEDCSVLSLTPCPPSPKRGRGNLSKESQPARRDESHTFPDSPVKNCRVRSGL